MTYSLILYRDGLIRLFTKFIERMKTRMTTLSSVIRRNDILIEESKVGESYMKKATENSQSAFCKGEDKDDSDKFYFLFENVFRGSVEEIKRRQSVYLRYVVEARANSRGQFFLDAGCGRCEFLTLLKGHGISARGVDTNRIAAELGKKLNVDVISLDAFEYLESLEDNSLIGLSMFQVIEHFDFRRVDDILETAYKKISPNGIIIIESVNPYCPTALGKFYLDPTHIRPYASDLMKFMLEWHGFEKVKIIYSSPLPRRLLFGEPAANYQDYAVLGGKTGL